MTQPSSPRRPQAPSFALLCSHPAHFIALGFGSGLAPKAPGSFGTLAAWLLFPLPHAAFPAWGFFVFLALCMALGCWAVAHTGRALGVIDHGAIVWDEFVAMWLVLAFTPSDWRWQIAAFVLFRLFDITKPPPIRQCDARIKNAFGVMFDDLLAAAYTLLVLRAAQYWLA